MEVVRGQGESRVDLFSAAIYFYFCMLFNLLGEYFYVYFIEENWISYCLALDWKLGSWTVLSSLDYCLYSLVWYQMAQNLVSSVTLPVLFFQLGFTFGNVVGMYLAQNYDVSGHIHIHPDSMSQICSDLSLLKSGTPSSINEIHRPEENVLNFVERLSIVWKIHLTEASVLHYHHKRAKSHQFKMVLWSWTMFVSPE